jgi:septal ring factor EnvC (AmiA/AmiB activator)
MTIAAVLAFVSAVAVRLKPERNPDIERQRDEARAEVKSLRREIEEVRSELFAARSALQFLDQPMRPHPYELLQMVQQMNQQHALAAYQHGLQQSQHNAVPFCNCVPGRGEFLLGQLDPPQ